MSSSSDWLRLGRGALGALAEFCRRRRETFYPKTDLGAGDDLELLRRRRAEAAAGTQAVADVCSDFFGARSESVALLEGAGTFNALYRVNAGGASYVCRVNLRAASDYAFEFLIDGWAGEVLRRRGLPHAPVLLVDLSRASCPFDYELSAEAEGQTLRSFEDEETQETPTGLLEELGRAAASVHEIETEGFGLLDVRPIVSDGAARGRGLLKTWGEYVLLNLVEHVEACLRIGAVDEAEAARIRRAFDAAAGLLDDSPSRLLHGDLGAHNVFADGERVTALIDWEDALAGDPVFDIAYWGTFVRDPMREPFLAGYRSVRRLPEDFERRYWLYYLRVALSKTVHRHLFGYAERPGRPPASRRIQKGLERFEAAV